MKLKYLVWLIKGIESFELIYSGGEYSTKEFFLLCWIWISNNNITIVISNPYFQLFIFIGFDWMQILLFQKQFQTKYFIHNFKHNINLCEFLYSNKLETLQCRHTIQGGRGDEQLLSALLYFSLTFYHFLSLLLLMVVFPGCRATWTSSDTSKTSSFHFIPVSSSLYCRKNKVQCCLLGYSVLIFIFNTSDLKIVFLVAMELFWSS